MPIFTKTGVFLQRIETSNDVQIIIKLIRPNNYSDATNQHLPDILTHAPTLTLHVNNHDKTVKLDFDPWSDMNVNSDSSIDEKDIGIVTDLALAYYHQTIITSEFASYLYRLPADPPEFRIGVEILELDEDDQKFYSYDVLETESLDSGSRFQGARRNPQSGTVYEYGTALEALLKAFIKLEL